MKLYEAFGAWTITNALYINFNNTAAAKGTPPPRHFAWWLTNYLSPSHNTAHFYLLFLLRHSLYADARSLHPWNSSIQNQGKRVRGYGEQNYVSSYADVELNKFQNLTVMLTVAFNQFINPVAIDAIGWWYYLVYCGWLIVELVFVVTFIVETKGKVFQLSRIATHLYLNRSHSGGNSCLIWWW